MRRRRPQRPEPRGGGPEGEACLPLPEEGGSGRGDAVPPCTVLWSSGGRAFRLGDRLACAPAMGDVSSAIPNDLISYGGNAESHNGQLRDWAKSVTTALDALRKSKPDPGL